jgi:hypothetical protein
MRFKDSNLSTSWPAFQVFWEDVADHVKWNIVCAGKLFCGHLAVAGNTWNIYLVYSQNGHQGNNVMKRLKKPPEIAAVNLRWQGCGQVDWVECQLCPKTLNQTAESLQLVVIQWQWKHQIDPAKAHVTVNYFEGSDGLAMSKLSRFLEFLRSKAKMLEPTKWRNKSLVVYLTV